MIVKNVKHFVKTYFYFSATERKGVLWLLVTILLIASAPSVYNTLFAPKLPDFQVSTLPSIANNTTEYAGGNSAITHHAQFTNLSPIDPNHATETEWKQFGLSDKQIKTIHKYLNAGGKIRRSEDIRKLYGLTEKQKELIIPFVRFPSSLNENSVQITDSSRFVKKKVQYPVEINVADSETLVALYRIGPKMASKIINYRNQLGGFKSIEQLTEIWGFDEDILFDLKGKITVDSTQAKIFNLNTVKLEELRTHPYFKYKASSVIINYRTHHGNYKRVEDILKTGVIADSSFQKMKRYLTVE